jgi:hypothetical protein
MEIWVELGAIRRGWQLPRYMLPTSPHNPIPSLETKKIKLYTPENSLNRVVFGNLSMSPNKLCFSKRLKNSTNDLSTDVPDIVELAEATKKKPTKPTENQPVISV